MERPVKNVVIVVLMMIASSCGADRTGWGRGKLVVVREGPALQVRRSTIHVDEATGDTVMSWIGIRLPPGSKPLAELQVSVFDDRDHDGTPQPDEVMIHRSCSEATDKIVFSDLRLPAKETKPTTSVLVQVRRQDGHVLVERFPFQPD
jgi:hypothetical protein